MARVKHRWKRIITARRSAADLPQDAPPPPLTHPCMPLSRMSAEAHVGLSHPYWNCHTHNVKSAFSSDGSDPNCHWPLLVPWY